MGLTDKAHELLTEKLRNEDRQYYSEKEIKRLFKTNLEVDDLNQLLFDLMKEGRLCRDDDSWLLPRSDHESHRAIHEAYSLATDKVPERQSWKEIAEWSDFEKAEDPAEVLKHIIGFIGGPEAEEEHDKVDKQGIFFWK